jgi:hypothetical protein
MPVAGASIPCSAPSLARGGWQLRAIDDSKLRMREEVEAPFRKVRLFFFWSFVGSASVGLFISVLRLLALTQGIDQGQTVEDLAQNIAIDIGAVGISGFLIQRDLSAQRSRLARLETGAQLAALRVRLQMENDEATVSLSDMRRGRGREKRVVIVAGGSAAVEDCVQSSQARSQELVSSDITVVPLVLDMEGEEILCSGGESFMEGAQRQQHIALPVLLNNWQDWVQKEAETAIGQGFDPIGEGFAVVLKKNGRVGLRRRGMPDWAEVVGDVSARKEAGLDVTNI